ncbi:transcriptional regulator, LacI family [Coriobacterium glomerans PW2]|uniref:Transcriptional regulator, LacI family n=1 Tax=Coriobacterium glomerans (strain ATCC 49209 / DSM 20642 / JCM 10262 / PW2) TaxID=700015 RepID=F2NAF8_CORGP|nr:LacI family DNA-binding transcriptional regulator [Coriobacterium glomerans]AEB06485.1 transcriptional regulator, LacI family [Coriobacterium glomerans PW2]
MSKVSIREISRRTGFSPATVSNALNNRPGVGSQNAAAIIRTARELGYYYVKKLKRIQFVIARQSGRMIDEGSFRLAVINGIECEAKRHGLSTSYVTIELTDTVSRRRQATSIISDTASGVILLGTEMLEKDYQLFSGTKQPLVVVDGKSDNMFFETIVFSNEGSAYHAVNHLIKNGHRKIGYLAGGLRIRNFPIRERGYRRALEDAGIPVRDCYKVLLGTEKPETAANDMLAWLDTNPELPTAFFADNDALAVGAMSALGNKGYSVPDDISMVGFDDVEYAAIARPPLTTIHVPRFEIGRMAVQRLIAQTESQKPFTCVTHVSTSLVERESVRSV